MSDKNTKPVLLVKKSDSKKGSLWNTLTNRRIVRQHGDSDEIPEDDLHAIQKYTSPVPIPQTSPEETEATLSDIEKTIQQLKEKEKPPPAPNRPSSDSSTKFFDDEE